MSDIPPEVVRFFRAQGPIDPSLIDPSSISPPGTFWTKDISNAYRYQAMNPGRDIIYVDIPKSELFRHGITNDPLWGQTGGYEVQLPVELTSRFNPQPYVGRQMAIPGREEVLSRYFPVGTGLSGDAEEQLLRQLVDYERLYPDLMDRLTAMYPADETGYMGMEINTKGNPGSPLWSDGDYFSRFTDEPLRQGTAAADLPELLDFNIHYDPEAMNRPLGGLSGRYMRNSLDAPMRMRMAEFARQFDDPDKYFRELGERVIPPEALHLTNGRPISVDDFAWSAVSVPLDSERQFMSKTGDSIKPHRQFEKGLRRGLNQMKSQGFRGATNLGGAASVASLPLALLGGSLGLPQPVTRVGAGALAGAPFGLPGVLGGAALGGLASVVDPKSLLGQALGAIV